MTLDEEWQIFQIVNDLSYYWSVVQLIKLNDNLLSFDL